MKKLKFTLFLIAFCFLATTVLVGAFSTGSIDPAIQQSERTSIVIGLPFLFLTAV